MKHALLATTIVALSTLTADAALITWGAAQNIAGDTDVSTNGTFVDAVMFSPGFSTADTTINAVTFTDVNAFSTSSSGIFSWTPITGGSAATSPVGAFGTLSAEYRSMLGTSARDNFTLTMGGLTIGDTYEFQWWGNLSGSNGFGVTTTATAGNAVTLDINTTDTNGGLGQYVIGTFIADAATQQVAFTSSQLLRMNGAQLRNITPEPAAVPEPGTALAGVMLAGLLGLRRRRD